MNATQATMTSPHIDGPRWHDSSSPSFLSVRTPHVFRRLAIALGVVFALFLVSLGITPWQQSITGQGRVIALSPTERHQVLEAPVSGRVSAVLVAEGQSVDTDEIVVEIADVDPRYLERLQSEAELIRTRETAASTRLQSIEDRVVALQRSRELALTAADARITMSQDRVRQAEQALTALRAAADAATLNLPRIEELARQGLKSTRELELAQLDAKRASADVARAEAALSAAKSDVESTRAERRKIEQDATASINDARASAESARAEAANARADIVRVETRIARQLTQSVRVPRDSAVFRVLAQEGQLVKEGDPLVELVPRTQSRAVEIWVDGNDAALVYPGREVRLQFEGWPAIQFVGWPEAARGTFGGTVKLVDIHDDGTGRFRVVVVPIEGQPWPTPELLRQGVRANGWVLLDEVRLGWELWRRLNAFPPTVKPPPSATSSRKSSGKDKA